MRTLEEILQHFFGCKKPFRKDGELTKRGEKAFQELESLCDDLRRLGVIEDDSDYKGQLYNILSEDY